MRGGFFRSSNGTGVAGTLKIRSPTSRGSSRNTLEARITTGAISAATLLLSRPTYLPGEVVEA